MSGGKQPKPADTLRAALESGDRSARTHFMNQIHDELDAAEDFERGPGDVDTLNEQGT